MIQQIYTLMHRQTEKHSIKELCKLYEVSRSGYYKWLRRNGQANRYEKAQKQLDEYVKDIHTHYPSMGYRQIRDTLLLQTGWAVCDLSVWRSMRRLHLHGYIRKSKYPAQSGNENDLHPNLLNREFHAAKPLQKVASDITYIKHGGKWFYLVCYLDLFNNEIVEWQLSDSFDNHFVIQSAKRLLEKAKCTGCPILLHSDQGNQYTSAGYQALLREYNAIQSMSRAGTPRDNAVMESFFGRFKDVLRFQYRYWERDDLTTVISDVISYFNNVRPLRKLNGKPPVLFRIQQVV